MEVTVHTGANPGNAANAPSSYHLSFDLSEPAAHLGERMEDVYQVAFDYAMDGLTSVLIKLSQDKAVDAAAELANVGIGTAVVGIGGTLAAGVAEFNDLMNDTHNVPVTAWASYRDSISFKGTQDDGNSNTPLTYLYQTQGGVRIATTSTGLKFAGGSEDDTIYGSGKNNNMGGGDGSDTLRGGKGNDDLNGNRGGTAGGGTDRMFGDENKDKLTLNGNDQGTGGSGDDTFVFVGTGAKVLDFNWQSDHLIGLDTIASFHEGSLGNGAYYLKDLTDVNGNFVDYVGDDYHTTNGHFSVGLLNTLLDAAGIL